MTGANQPPFAVCSICKKLQPSSEFRYRSKARGIRMKQCRACRRETDRRKRWVAREQKATEKAAAAYAALAKSRSFIELQQAIEATVKELGGPEGLGSRLGRYISAELSHPVSSRKRLAFKAACRLLSLSIELEKQAEKAVATARTK